MEEKGAENMRPRSRSLLVLTVAAAAGFVGGAQAQLRDVSQTPNPRNAGIRKTFTQEIGAGRGTVTMADSSLFIISRDPFRAIRRGRQIFQRKFQVSQGFGPGFHDGAVGTTTLDIAKDRALGAGVVDSCAGCHGRPRGSAGHGGDVVTRPDSRDAPHLFGLGLQEMLGDEITAELRQIRATATTDARAGGMPVTRPLMSKGVDYGTIKVDAMGVVDTTNVKGVDPDLRVRPFFAQGGTISIREFLVGALHAEMGMEASSDPDLQTASSGGRIVTPAGMVLDGAKDRIEAP